jgi:hypothetical protein
MEQIQPQGIIRPWRGFKWPRAIPRPFRTQNMHRVHGYIHRICQRGKVKPHFSIFDVGKVDQWSTFDRLEAKDLPKSLKVKPTMAE